MRFLLLYEVNMEVAIDRDELAAFAKKQLDDAEHRYHRACHNSAMGGGSGTASRGGIEEAEMYLAGVLGIIPLKYQEAWRTRKNKEDPEYQQYLRLKEKFE